MYTFSQTQQIGSDGEMWAIEQLEAFGYQCKFHPDFCNEGYDMTVNGLPTEIKFAHRTKRKRTWKNRAGVIFENYYDRWQWQIHPTSHRQTDWLLILIADYRGTKYTFIVPGGLVLDRTHIQITSHPNKYRGWLAAWLNRWEIIDYLANGIYRNGGPLFEQWAERIAA